MEIGSMRIDYGSKSGDNHSNNESEHQKYNLGSNGMFLFIIVVVMLIITAIIVIKDADDKRNQVLDDWIYFNVTESHPLAETSSKFVGSYSYGNNDYSTFEITIQYKDLEGDTTSCETKYVLIPNKDPMEKDILSFKFDGKFCPYANR